MDLYRDCLNYLEMVNLMSQTEMPESLNMKQCLQNVARAQKRFSECLAVDLERLRTILYKLDIAINFRVPMNEREKISIHANNLDYFLASKAVQRFLAGKSDEITTRYGIIKHDIFQKH